MVFLTPNQQCQSTEGKFTDTNSTATHQTTSLLQPVTTKILGLLSADENALLVSQTSLKFGEYTFSAAGPAAWNNCLADIRTTTSFQQDAVNFLFTEIYNILEIRLLIFCCILSQCTIVSRLVFKHYNLTLLLLLLLLKVWRTCLQCSCLQCFDAVGWAAGRASGL